MNLQPVNESSTENKMKKKLDSVKKQKPPVIRQTLTSMYRIAKANPLLVYNQEKKPQGKCNNDFGISKIKLPKSVLKLDIKNYSLNNGSMQENTRTSYLQSKPSSKSINSLQKTSFHSRSLIRFSEAKDNKTSLNANQRNIKPLTLTKRRSLSAEHFERKKETVKSTGVPDSNIQKTFSKSLNALGKKTVAFKTISPVVEENSFEIRSMNGENKRSTLGKVATPVPRKYYSSTPKKPNPPVNELQERLHMWMQKHKKPAENYKHLKCFGIPYNDNEDKENIEDPKLNISESYEDLKISCDPPDDIVDDRVNSDIVQAALRDLNNLIYDGYPIEQCEDWLGMIRKKYTNIDQEYQYWECRAAIEQARGDIISAVNSLRSAIVQGAEVKSVDDCLEQLLQKFSLLNIDTNAQEKSAESKHDRAKIILDARTVFKSSIIQFAVQEKATNKKKKYEDTDAKYLITPVRRSTRKSRSGYISTPGVKICTSMQELDKDISDNISFRTNNALADSFRY